MIRKRMSRHDDEMIYQLILHELVPKTATGYCPHTHSYVAIRNRLNQNVTFVSTQSYSKISGFISFQARNPTLFIDLLAVQPRERGRGIGNLLLRTAEQTGKQLGCMQAQLFVDDRNGRGIHFYRKLGYQPIQHMTHIRCYVMQKVFSS